MLLDPPPGAFVAGVTPPPGEYVVGVIPPPGEYVVGVIPPPGEYVVGVAADILSKGLMGEAGVMPRCGCIAE